MTMTQTNPIQATLKPLPKTIHQTLPMTILATQMNPIQTTLTLNRLKKKKRNKSVWGYAAGPSPAGA
jgi:hypothetical protein